VTERSDALDPKKDIFKSGSAERIAQSLSRLRGAFGREAA